MKNEKEGNGSVYAGSQQWQNVAWKCFKSRGIKLRRLLRMGSERMLHDQSVRNMKLANRDKCVCSSLLRFSDETPVNPQFPTPIALSRFASRMHLLPNLSPAFWSFPMRYSSMISASYSRGPITPLTRLIERGFGFKMLQGPKDWMW